MNVHIAARPARPSPKSESNLLVSPSLREEQLPNSRLGLLHDEAEPRVDRVVDGDAAILASEHHAPQAGLPVGRWRRAGPLRQLVDRVQGKLAILLRASLCHDDLGVLSRSALEARRYHLVIASAATNLHFVLQEHQQTLHDELRDELLVLGIVRHLLHQCSLAILLKLPQHVLPALDLLQPRLVDGRGACDCVLRLYQLRLSEILLSDLVLRRIHYLELLNAELLECLRTDLLGLILGLVHDELRHLQDLLLGLLRCVHGFPPVCKAGQARPLQNTRRG
mmetsp:Transcript_25854/g.54573  ORF Transcript_25854/g.54573 Transcript_25854/m.54573 type:complete len:280 (-) Transcript_25854:43-882(-)